jgi:hypothetical protein
MEGKGEKVDKVTGGKEQKECHTDRGQWTKNKIKERESCEQGLGECRGSR